MAGETVEGTDALPLEENLLLGFLLQMYMVHLNHTYCRPHMEIYIWGGGIPEKD